MRDAVVNLPVEALAQLMPMHMIVNDHGAVLSVGPTLLKLVPGLGSGLHGCLVSGRAGQGAEAIDAIRNAVDRGLRLFLRVQHIADLVLRGHGVRLSDGTMLVNLGFGIGLTRAIRKAHLTDADFAPSDLAMELLFLQEANRGVLNELSRFNHQLAAAREVALLQAQTDPLTGLGNRRALEGALAIAMRCSGDERQDRPTPFALLHMDLDHFKQVNDRLGHKAGDDLLRDVGKVLHGLVRKEDMAARIGGDEFVLILRGMVCPTAIAQVAERLIGSIRDLSPPQLTDLHVSASIGVVIWHHDRFETPETLLDMADAALYASKRKGRGCATIA